jgi:uncharacterized protein (DUF1501 family)
MTKPYIVSGIDRRSFLRIGGNSIIFLGLTSARTFADPWSAQTSPPHIDAGVLVVIFQRGAADGLHMVTPYRDRDYRRGRGALALEEPGKKNGTLDLGDGFAFHPALEKLHGLYKEGRLAVIHAVGSPDPTRSHFDAQDYMETGTPGVKSTPDGWLTRALKALEASSSDRPSPFRAVALTSTMPRSLAAAPDAIAMQDFSKMKINRRVSSLTERIYEMYRKDPHQAFAEAGDEATRAIALFREKDPLSLSVREGVQYPRGRMSGVFQQLAKLLRSDLGIRIAFIESGGWDTHFGQGAATGQMANSLRELSGCLASFFEDLGPGRPVTLLTMTEFGRTVAVNGAGGTDHGHGAAMFVMGHGVRGGQVLGEWPGLSTASLYQGRDLAVTTDFRDVLSEVAVSTLALPGDVNLFPGYEARSGPGAMVT